MSNISTFLLIFIAILVIAGWISAEMISSKSARANKKSSLRAAKLEKENDQLVQAIAKEQERYQNLRSEYDKAKEARDQIREFEKEYNKMLKSYNRFSDGIDSLREMVSAKKYSSNILSKEVLLHLEEHCPSLDKLAAMRNESTKEVFKRIKKRMEGEA